MKHEAQLPAGVTVSAGRGGLERVVIDTELARAEVYLHGAHVTQFHPRHTSKPMLWMSGASLFEPNKPIRGGVPICFPWFGPKDDDAQAPAHGVARLLPWNLTSANRSAGGSVVVALELRSADHDRARATGEWVIRHEVTIGRSLQMQLIVQNDGPTPFRFEEALHSYFAVGDVKQIAVRGLDGATFLDRLQPGKKFTQDANPIRFVAETDRSYLGTTAACTIDDPGLGRKITIEKSGSNTTVVWNPWTAKSKAMPDFGDDEWPGMVCIETANANEDAVTLAPGARHVMRAHISVA